MSIHDQLAARAVYAGLRRMTEDRQVIKSAYSFWESTMSSVEFDVVSVVASLEEYLDLSGQEKKTLMVALHAASNRLVDELPPVPGIISGAAVSAVDKPTSQATPKETAAPHIQVTQRYLQLFAQHMRKVDNAEFTDFRQEVASDGLDEINEPLNTVITRWASDGMAVLTLNNEVTEDDCKALAHQMYMLAVEFVGPNPVDQVVLNAVNDCLTLDAAARFNPRDLVN